MAASNSQDNCPLEQNIPQWKRELILRRRTLCRTLPAGNTSVKLTCPSVVTAVKQADQTTAVEDVIRKQHRCSSSAVASSKALLDQADGDFHPSEHGGNSSLAFTDSAAVVSNMRLLEHRVDAGSDLINGISMDNSTSDMRTVKYNDRMGDEKSSKSRVSRAVLDNSATTSENSNFYRATDDGSESDSSEELRYGPGIVNKLKDKYMSMTLRESQGKTARSSVNHMRRAASLENIVDSDHLGSGKQQTKVQQKFYKRSDVTNKSTQVQNLVQPHRYRGINRGNDSLKRARSVETLLRYDSRSTASSGNVVKNEPSHTGHLHKKFGRDLKVPNVQLGKSLCKDDIIIVENKPKVESSPSLSEEIQQTSKLTSPSGIRTANVTAETELPPPDLVKQTLRIFERGPASGKLGCSVNSKSILKSKSKINASVTSSGTHVGTVNKPVLSPKPSPEKIRQNSPSKPISPRKVASSEQQLFSFNLNNRSHLSEIHSSPPTSPVGFKSSLDRLKSPSPTTDIHKQLTVSIPQDSDGDSSSLSPVHSSVNIVNGRVEEVTVHLDSSDSIDGTVKIVSHSALENIRKCGSSEVYHFIPNGGAGQEKPKTYLPGAQIPSRLKTPSPVPQKSDSSVLHKTVSSSMKSPSSPQTQVKQVGVIKPIITTKTTSNSSTLTSRERENNVKNREKSIEQGVIPVTRVKETSSQHSEIEKNHCESTTSESVFSSKLLRETKVPGLWDKKQPSNELTYNFVNSKSSIPDYIPNDGLIISKKPAKPKPGESGYIRLSGSTEDSSTDADVDFDDSPPSPCSVVVVGGNVLINGRSNMRKDNRSRNMHISFNDSATTTFEYPSEASLMGEMIPPAPTVSAPSGGSSLASYTPSKVVLATEGFQLGVTPSAPPSAFLPNTSADQSPRDELVEEEQHLKPAEDGETMVWSEGKTADLLF